MLCNALRRDNRIHLEIGNFSPLDTNFSEDLELAISRSLA